MEKGLTVFLNDVRIDSGSNLNCYIDRNIICPKQNNLFSNIFLILIINT